MEPIPNDGETAQPTPTTFGAWLKLRRIALDLTQQELADQAGCSVVTIRKMESDERKPSKQLAELLGTCLNIPEAEQSAFIAFARNEGPQPSHLSLDDAPWRHATPAVHAQPDIDRKDGDVTKPFASAEKPQPDIVNRHNLRATSPLFIGREAELVQLNCFLRRALAGQGNVVFVTGEAGTGKTTLIREFTRRAQAAHADLLVTLGSCNDLTGLSDPFLPFREVLAMLAGDVESGLAKGVITPENVRRLTGFLNVSGDALVRLGPVLLGTLISGSSLFAYADKFVTENPGWLDKVKKLTIAQETTETPPRIEQEQLFEQYTAVLKVLATQQPMIVWLDDLHWVDSSSASLLFYLVRSLESSPLLIVATYRPEDIAVEQKQDVPEHGSSFSAKQHPLINVINECKRYWGDIQIDLGQTIKNEGRQFVDAWLDTESNRLDETFRQAFFQRTGGHPLFTVELLRDLQERGVLRQDEAGRWMIESHLDWQALPAKVEGVIEKRVGRLEADLREALIIASVEGEQFTAEVVARVRAIEARTLVRRLSGELDKQHRLVQASGLQRAGRQRLSLYQFRHNLIQKYLYNSLDEMEQAYLHEDVANTLEMLYGTQSDKIAVQLAWHFQKAEITEKAVSYLLQAGKQAIGLSAMQEAIEHLTQGLALLETMPETPERASQEFALHLALSGPLAAIKGFTASETVAIYKRTHELVQQVEESPEHFLVLSQLARFYAHRSDYQTAYELSKQALALAQRAQDPTLLTTAQTVMGGCIIWQGEFLNAQASFEQSLATYDPQQNYPSLLPNNPAVISTSFLALSLWFLGYPEQAQG
ncbi:AAA family ATPase [Chloroflexi bacterium TSY]|nr:AAA family ATPase [Chloroflexi bacterium TSY]